MGISSGVGLVLDAGSACFQAWRVIRHQVETTGGFAHLSVATNNFMVLEDWAKNLSNPRLLGLQVEMVGTAFDGPHMALYGAAGKNSILESKVFWPWVVYVGAAGIDFHEESGVLLGYHCGDTERSDKALLFQCHCQHARIILATPRKIGNPGGHVLDLLSIDKLRPQAPIYLATTVPEPNSSEEEQFSAAKERFLSKGLEERIREKRVEFHWVMIARENDGVSKVVDELVVPARKTHA
jgi:hypothetical protein